MKVGQSTQPAFTEQKHSAVQVCANSAFQQAPQQCTHDRSCIHHTLMLGHPECVFLPVCLANILNELGILPSSMLNTV